MELQVLDWIVILVYISISSLLGFWYTRKAGSSLEDYFLAGRSLPWWVAGISIAATWFATDAPLAATSLVRQHGIYGNWIWWYEAAGLMLLVFFFAKFWRRANIMTDAEFMELRYSGKAASWLRVVYAVYNGLLKNCVIMGWVILAMIKFTQVLLNWDPLTAVIICSSLAVIYTSASGIWGVVSTDLFQFLTGLIGSILLACFIMFEYGGPSGLVEQLSMMNDIPKGTLDILPNPDHISSLEFISYLCLILVLWSRSGHDGYSGQRLFATKNDKHAVMSSFLWAFLGITVMTWPWIIVGLGSLISFPISEAGIHLMSDPELAYPMMIGKFMPVGLKGLLVASFLAAFMSTMDTHLCWGGSYMVNDIYIRFFKKEGTEKDYVWASRISILLLALFASIIAFYMDSIEKAWIYIIDLTAGMALIWALRWYWWRVNAISEITAIVCSLILANGKFILQLIQPLGVMSPTCYDFFYKFYLEDYDLIRAVMILLITSFVWIMMALLTKPTSKEVLTSFYRLVNPGGWWGNIAAQNPDIIPETNYKSRLSGWFLGVVFVYTSLLGIGYIVIDRFWIGMGLLFFSLISMYILFKKFDINPNKL